MPKRHGSDLDSTRDSLSMDSSRQARLHEAREALLSDRLNDARHICEAEMRPSERDPDWLLLRASIWATQGRAIEGLDDLLQVLRNDEQQAEALFRVGQIFFDLGEAAHAERYLELAVKHSGGKKSYQSLLRKAHRKALTENSSLDAPQSALPSAEDDSELDEDLAQRQANAMRGMERLHRFENETGLFNSRLQRSIGATRERMPQWSAVKHSARFRRLTRLGAVAAFLVLLIGGIGLLALRSCRSRHTRHDLLQQVDLAISRGDARSRWAAIDEARAALRADGDDDELALRLVWLLGQGFVEDRPDLTLLQEAQSLLGAHADEASPRALLGAGAVALAQGRPPGAQLSDHAFDEPLLESLRQQLLAQDALARAAFDQVLGPVEVASKSRPQSLILPLLAARAELWMGHAQKAESWLERAGQVLSGSVVHRLLRAQLAQSTGLRPAEIAPLLRPLLDDDVPPRPQMAAMSMAVGLRAQIAVEVDQAPAIDDIIARVGKDSTLALAAAESLLHAGWPDLAEHVLVAAECKAPAHVRLAIAAARSDLEAARQALDGADLRAAPWLGSLAVAAAEAGDVELTEAALTRSEVLGYSACELAASAARVTLRRGTTLPAATAMTLMSCPVVGSVALYLAERGPRRDYGSKDSAPARPKDLRRRLQNMHGLNFERQLALGELALWQQEPALADEAGRRALAACMHSVRGLDLRLRASTSVGDYPKISTLYQTAPKPLREHPLVAGFVALARLDRGEGAGLRRFLAQHAGEAEDRGLAPATAVQGASQNSRRRWRDALRRLQKADASPYVLEVRALLQFRLGDLNAAQRLLDAVQGAPERALQRNFLRLNLAFARGEKRTYLRLLSKLGKRAQDQLNHVPAMLDLQLRRAEFIDNKRRRGTALDALEQAVQDQGRYDRRAPYLNRIKRRIRQARRQMRSFPDAR